MIAGVLFAGLLAPAVLSASDVIPPSPPSALTGAAASCGQVNLSWNAAQDDPGGAGLKSYVITRNDPNGELFRQVLEVSIGADRITFADTNYVRSSATLNYTVAAEDYAGNRSSASNLETVVTPACPNSGSQQTVDSTHMQPLGKSIASYGTRTAIIYTKRNAELKLDAWLYVHDDDTNQSSHFLLHTNPGYRQIETDYVLTSPTELWALSHYNGVGGNVLVSQYRLNGSPFPTSATLLSTKALGGSGSFAKHLIRLQSGALVAAWNEDNTSKPDGTVDAGFAYRSAGGAWTVMFPVNIPNPFGGGITLSRIALAQHPADGSVWAFLKRDSFHDITALHFSETGNNLALDWITPGFISQVAHGSNGPETEFPFMSAAPDQSRNAIVLAYENNDDRIIYVDRYNGMSGVFLKEAGATVAVIGANGDRSFIPVPAYMERDVQFGFSVLADGTLWMAYPPVNHNTLTWNEVYAVSYFNGAWAPPAFVGYNYGYYSAWGGSGNGDPGFLISRPGAAEVAFETPDVKISTFLLSGAAPAPVDGIAPSTSITSPANGSSVSGVVTVTAAASDNVGVTEVSLLLDGAPAGVKTSAPYTFPWDTNASGAGSHTLQTVARDSAGNTGYSAPITSMVASSPNPDVAPPTVAITNPTAAVKRNNVVTISVNATDDVRVTKVEIYVDGSHVASLTNAPYTYAWKVPGKMQPHTIKAIAYDGAGKTATTSITVSVLK
jgi:hypothetical protein